MNQHWLAWVPIVLTALLMYLAKITNYGVTHYNIFLLLLITWSAVLIFYYRALVVGQRKNERH